VYEHIRPVLMVTAYFICTRAKGGGLVGDRPDGCVGTAVRACAFFFL